MLGFAPLARAPISSLANPSVPIVHLTDSVAVGAAGSSLPIHLLPAQLTLADSVPHTALDGISALRDGLALEAGLALVYRELLQVSVALGHSQTLSYTAIARVVDALLLSEAVGSVLEAHAVIAEALTLGAMASGTPVSSLADSVTLTTTAASHYTAIAQLIDALALQAAQTHTATLAIALKDGITFGATQNTSLDAIAALRDRLEFVLQVAIDNEQYVAWSMNAASKGATRYTNYPFNSFMRIGGRYYGVSDTGRYRLDGDNDAGSPIAAKLRLGMSSLGTRLLKRMASAYLGFTASGDLRLKVIVANEVTGAREAHVYRLYARGAQSMRESRVQIGKGLKSVYWDFQIENVAGGDFEIDVVEILPLMLERRIRGNAGGKA